LEVTDLPVTDSRAFLASRKARFRVDEFFGGLAPHVQEIDVFTGVGGGDCGVAFKSGEVYLVQASLGNDGQVHASICSSTRRVTGEDFAVRVLRQRRDGQAVPSLTGRIAQTDRNFVGLLGTSAPRPLANTLVRARADGKLYETHADSNGLYAFYNLPPGRYEFVPDLPSGTTLSWYIGSDDPPTAVQLNAGACQEHNIEVFASGSIQGRVVDSLNKPLSHAFVYVIPAGQVPLPNERELYWASQGEQGFFKFVHIPPGKYLIFVNPEDSAKPDFPYRRTFYPGAHDREAAAIITVRGGEQISNLEIRLEQQFVPRHFTVRVTWADGRLIRDFVFVTAKGTANDHVVSHAHQADLKRSVLDLTTLPDEAYEVEAELTCRYADERSLGPGTTLKSNREFLGPRDTRKELTLKMPVSRCPEIQGKALVTEH
jgi:hypothetical protein